MKLHWLLSGILGFLLCGLPANAGKLMSWDFASQNNRLTFTTDEDVEPQIKLVENPTRLVIELPGTTLGRTTVREKYLGSVRGFRVGQSSEDTVSLVIELAPGYNIDLDRVKLKNKDDKRWTIKIPNPRIAPTTTADNSLDSDNNRRVNNRGLNRNRTPIRPLNPTNNSTNNSRPIAPTPQPDNTSGSINRVTNSSSSSSPYVKATSHGHQRK